MTGLPVVLAAEGRRAVVCGSGRAATYKIAALVDAGAKVTVVSPGPDPRPALAHTNGDIDDIGDTGEFGDIPDVADLVTGGTADTDQRRTDGTGGVVWHARPWRPGDAAGAWLVVTAADDVAVNEAVAAEARAAGALVLRADRPAEGDLWFPAVYRSGAVTVAVTTGACAPGVARWVRDQIAGTDAGRWAPLAEWAATHRPADLAAVARHVQEEWP